MVAAMAQVLPLPLFFVAMQYKISIIQSPTSGVYENHMTEIHDC